MTLTEQWKKGELKKNKYWVKYKNGKIDTWELSEGITIESKPEIIEVLAPVPSFEEWQKMKEQRDACAWALDKIGDVLVKHKLVKKIDNATGDSDDKK